MSEAQHGCRLGHQPRFAWIDSRGAALGYGAESAVAGADIAQYHECRGAAAEALAHIRTPGALADRMEAHVGELAAEALERGPLRRPRYQPRREALLHGSAPAGAPWARRQRSSEHHVIGL
jgi:hypothetical protein